MLVVSARHEYLVVARDHTHYQHREGHVEENAEPFEEGTQPEVFAVDGGTGHKTENQKGADMRETVDKGNALVYCLRVGVTSLIVVIIFGFEMVNDLSKQGFSVFIHEMSYRGEVEC